MDTHNVWWEGSIIFSGTYDECNDFVQERYERGDCFNPGEIVPA